MTGLKCGAAWLANYYMVPIRTGVLRDLRQQLYDKVLSLPMGYFTEARRGDVISRMTNDVNEVEASIMSALDILFKDPIMILVYLMMGAVGVPVFAGFSGGIGHLAGITGGYVLGFLPAAAIAGSVSDRKSDAVRAAGCFAGLAVCYAAGSAWFVLHGSRGAAGWGAAFVSCVVPYILPDAGRILLALAVSRILCRHIRLGK